MSRSLPRIASITFAAIALLLAGCKNDSESAISGVVDQQKEMVSILKGVTDKASAVAAKDKLQALGKKMSEFGAKMDKKKSNDAEMTKAVEKYKPELAQAQKDMQSEMERIAKIPGAMEPLIAAMSGLDVGGSGMFPVQ